MGRTKKRVSTATKIEKAEKLVLKTKEDYDKAVEGLKKLREREKKEKQEALLDAVFKSRRSHEEIMGFIKGESDEMDE